MGLFGTHFLRSANEYLGYEGGASVDPQFKEGGYLFLASTKSSLEGKMGGKAVLEANHKAQLSLGADVALLDPEGIKKRFPWMSTEGIDAGGFGLKGTTPTHPI